MATYNLETIKARLAQLANADKPAKKDSPFKDKPKLTFFKPDMGECEIRFLPYLDRNNQPFEEVLYYNNIAENRVTVPKQYGMEDEIHDFLAVLEKERKKKEVWMEWNRLRAKPRFYALLIVRGEEEKGVQVWEFSPDVCKDIYAVLTHKNYVKKDVMSPTDGFDFTLQVSPVPGKVFKGKPVKGYKLIASIESSPLSESKKQVETWLKDMPNLYEYFKGFCPKADKVQAILENYTTGGGVPSAASDNGSGDRPPPVASTNKQLSYPPSATKTEVGEEEDIDEAFKDL